VRSTKGKKIASSKKKRTETSGSRAWRAALLRRKIVQTVRDINKKESHPALRGGKKKVFLQKETRGKKERLRFVLERITKIKKSLSY